MRSRPRRSVSYVAAGLLLGAAAAAVPGTPATAAPPATTGTERPAAAAHLGQPKGASPSVSTWAHDHALAALSEHAAAFRAGPHDAFTPRGQVLVDTDGTTHVRYDRSYRGLPVLGGDVVVHLAAGGAYRSASLTLSRALTTRTAAAVSRAEAVRTAAARFGGSVRSGSARLVVDALEANPVLAWDALLSGTTGDGPSRLHVVVDATTGAVLRTWDDVEHAVGNSVNSGQVTIGTSGSAGAYQLSDPTRGNNSTGDLFGGTSGSGTTFTDADNVWGNSTTSDRASAGVDAQYVAQETWDYYKNVLYRNGIWDNGTGVRSRVHYGSGVENAQWSSTSHDIWYGDGYQNQHPWAELDVGGHEMTHGLTQATAGLNYSGESGGLNESTSDVFGTMVEFYANNPNDVPDYLHAEKVDADGKGLPNRYLDRPSRDGHSADCYYSGIGGLDVHYSSGVGNHAFYLMSEGSGPKVVNGVSYDSPTCNGVSVSPIGRSIAAGIWYRALAVYMTSGTSYQQARDDMVYSALDLYGNGSSQCIGVSAAFAAVNLTGSSYVVCTHTAIAVSLSCHQTGDSVFHCDVSYSGGTPPYTVQWSSSGDVAYTYTDDVSADAICNTGYTVTPTVTVSDGYWGNGQDSNTFYCSPAPDV